MPSSPGFPSCLCRISTASSAHLLSPGNAVRIPNAPRCGFAPLRSEQGLCSLPSLPCPCRPTSSPEGFGLGRRMLVSIQRPFQPHQPALPGMQLRRFSTTWRVVACPFGRVYWLAVGGLLTAHQSPDDALSSSPRLRNKPPFAGLISCNHVFPANV